METLVLILMDVNIFHFTTTESCKDRTLPEAAQIDYQYIKTDLNCAECKRYSYLFGLRHFLVVRKQRHGQLDQD